MKAAVPTMRMAEGMYTPVMYCGANGPVGFAVWADIGEGVVYGWCLVEECRRPVREALDVCCMVEYLSGFGSKMLAPALVLLTS